MLIGDGSAILVEVTRAFSDQARRIERIDAVLLTHGPRGAVGAWRSAAAIMAAAAPVPAPKKPSGSWPVSGWWRGQRVAARGVR